MEDKRVMDAQKRVCGVDEAGRGPLAGPVYAAAVVLDPARPIRGLADSKLLAEERRDELALKIRERALAWGVGSASVEEIDRLNIFQATMLAMQRAVAALALTPHEAWIDGNKCPALPVPARAFVGGDRSKRPISAASILAKTSRDAEMRQLHARYPEYGFDRHKGYSTSDHLDALGRHGPCEIHRRSFQPVGVFFHQDLFTQGWGTMAQALRVRSYRLFCEALKLSGGAGLPGKGASQRSMLATFDELERCLRSDYADVLASPDAAYHVALVEELLREGRAALRSRSPSGARK